MGNTVPVEGVGERLPGTTTDYLQINSGVLFTYDAFQTSMFMISMMITSLTGTGKQYILHSDPVFFIYIYIYIVNI